MPTGDRALPYAMHRNWGLRARHPSILLQVALLLPETVACFPGVMDNGVDWHLTHGLLWQWLLLWIHGWDKQMGTDWLLRDQIAACCAILCACLLLGNHSSAPTSFLCHHVFCSAMLCSFQGGSCRGWIAWHVGWVSLCPLPNPVSLPPQPLPSSH